MLDLPANRRIILATDGMSINQAQALAERLKDYIWGVKAEDLYGMYGAGVCGGAMRNTDMFVDTKLHTIPTSVQNYIAKFDGIENLGFITLHCSGGLKMLTAAREKRDQLGMSAKLLGVTVLSSFDGAECNRTYDTSDVASKVFRFANLAAEARLDGLICAGPELQGLNNYQGTRDLTKVVVAIREEGQATHDQKRFYTIEQAVHEGGDYYVIGRPITEAKDPLTATKMFVEKIDVALQNRDKQ